MKPLKKILFILVSAPFFAGAQSNYQPGSVVNLKGDTIRGFIDYQDWDSNPASIYFKSTINDRDKKTFTKSDISFFKINGLATYKKYVCSISIDVTNPAHLVEGRDTSFKTDEVFLKVLQVGKNIALYSYADDIKIRFYVGEAPVYAPTELIFRLYYDVSANANGKTVYENEYQKQLFALANKYSALDDKLTATFSKTEYTKSDLLTIVSRINGISKAELQSKYMDHTKLGFYVSGILNVSTTSAPPGAAYSQAGGVSSTSFLPAAAIGLNVIPSPSSDKVELRFEVSGADAHFNAQYALKVDPFGKAEATYDQFVIYITPYIIYNVYNSPNFKFYLGAGVSSQRFLYSNSYFGNPNRSVPVGNFPDEPFYFHNNDGSFVFKTGVRINKKVEIFFNYFTKVITSDSPYFGFNTTVMQAGVSYLLGK